MSKKKILVVDDEEIHRECLRHIVKNSYSVIAANSGLLALGILENNEFDLVLLDINMPGIDGFETAKRIKSNPKLKNIKIFFATAEDPTEDILARSKAAGVSEFIGKPYAFLELHNLIDKHFNS